MKSSIKYAAAVSTAALVLTPAVVLATHPSSSMAPGNAQAYPYPDWPAIAKIGQPAQQAGQKTAEQTPAEPNKGEPGLLEKAGHALEMVTGRSTATPEAASQQRPQMKPGAAMQEQAAPQLGQQKAAGAGAPYPDFAAIAKTQPPSMEKAAPQQKPAEMPSAEAKPPGPGILEKAQRALETVTGHSAVTKETPEQSAAQQMKQPGTEKMAPQGQEPMKSAAAESYPYPDWPAIAKTGAPPAQKPGDSAEKGQPSLLEKAGQALGGSTGTPSQQGPSDLKTQQEQKAATEKTGPSLLEKAGQAIESLTGRSTKEAPQEAMPQKAAAPEQARPQAQQPQGTKTAGGESYPDWGAIAKTGPAPQE